MFDRFTQMRVTFDAESCQQSDTGCTRLAERVRRAAGHRRYHLRHRFRAFPIVDMCKNFR